MSVHQYIGARYVPYYYENSLDPTSTEWEPNVHYEALTVVTLPNNHSYISKKDVPDTIGSPALNAAYWLDTGSDNAYIQNLQDQIDIINNTDLPAIDGRLDALEEWVDVCGILRKNADNTWDVLNTGGHESTYIDHAEVDGNGRLNVIFDRTFSAIGSGMLTPDETYAKGKYSAGCSISTSKAIIEFVQNDISGLFKFNGNTPSMYGTVLDGNINQVIWDGVQGGFEVRFDDICQGGLATGIAITMLKDGNAYLDGALNFSGRVVGGATPSNVQIIPNKDLSANSLTGALFVTVSHANEVLANALPYDAYGNWWFHAKMKI